MKLFSQITCWLLFAAVILTLSGCTDSDMEIDWNLHGVWVNPDGTVQKNRQGLDISVSGALPTDFENREFMEMELNFTWPGSIVFPNNDKRTYGYAQYADRHEDQCLYLISTWLYDTEKNDTTGVSFVLCPDVGFVVAHVGDDYLVASIDPNADPAEIFDFYKEYVYVSQS